MYTVIYELDFQFNNESNLKQKVYLLGQTRTCILNFNTINSINLSYCFLVYLPIYKKNGNKIYILQYKHKP